MYDIFVSHASKDKEPIVKELVKELRTLHCDVWIDENNILCGDNILDEIEIGIKNSLCVVLILTEHFFRSNWTSLELGLSLEKNNEAIVIPMLSGITTEEIAKKFPFLLNTKYLSLDGLSIQKVAKKLKETVERFKERRKLIEPLDYQKTVRKLNNFETPVTNTISILISEYTQISKISIPAAISHVPRIGNAIINDIYDRVRLSSDKYIMGWRDKLDIISKRNTGINQNIKEHLSALMLVTELYSSTVNIEKDQKRLVDLSLSAVLNWYTSYLSVLMWNNKEKDYYEIASSEELSYTDFVDMYEIDKLCLRPDLIAPPDITYNWYQYNNYTHIAVRSGKTSKTVGYFALLPVTDELYQKIISGDFIDNNLSTEGIRQYNMSDFYKIYIAAVCVHPKHQNTMAFNKLYHALIQMIYELASEYEIYITDIITEASTKSGEKLCKILGLKKFINTNLETELYYATLLPPSLRLNSLFGHKLINFYKEKYTELCELL